MTNNNSNSDQNNNIENKKPSVPTDQTKRTLTQTIGPNNLTIEQATTDTSIKATKAPEPQMKKVVIVIAGHNYNIYCPVHEEAELRSAVFYINNFILDIKQEAPNLGQENLLVLACLNLYEKIHAHQKTADNHRRETEQSEALLNKIMQDAQSVL